MQASRDTERSDNRHEIYDLRISVREFEHAPPLAQPLSAQEQAILKLRDWSERWSRGDVEEDLIVVGGYDALVEDLTFRVVIAPKRGTIVAVNAGPSDQQPILEEILACYPDRVLIGAPLRQALLEIPHNGALQFTFSCEVRMTDSAEHLESGKPFETAFGMAMKHQSNIAANPLKADLKLLPAALLSMVHNERTECTLHDGQLGISGPDFKAAIDAATGRPIELTYGSRDAGNYLSFKTAVGALAAEQRRIEERLVNVTTKYDAKTPWRSALNFLLDEWISMLEREGKLQPDGERQNELATWRALRKLTGLWQPFMPDDLLPKWAGLKDDSPNGLKLPHQMTDFDFEDIWTSGPAHRALAGHLLGWHRQVTPKTSWLWPAARDAILLWGDENDEDELPRQSLLALLSSPEMGPLGAAFLEWMGIDDEVDARQASLDAFRREYQPLVAGDSWLSKWIFSLADAAGQLDDAELRALAGLLEEGESRQVIAAALPQLHARPDAPIAQRVAEVLDHLWKHWPNEPITVVRLPSPASDKPAMATTRAAPQTPLYEHLKGLEDLEAEIKKGAVIPGGSTTEQDKR